MTESGNALFRSAVAGTPLPQQAVGDVLIGHAHKGKIVHLPHHPVVDEYNAYPPETKDVRDRLAAKRMSLMKTDRSLFRQQDEESQTGTDG